MIGGPHILYRLYDKAGELLYIGITNNIQNRLEQHAQTKRWWPDVAEIKLETGFKDRTALENAEREAILQEIPRYNSFHNWRWHTKHKSEMPSQAARDAMNKLGEILMPDWYANNKPAEAS